MKGTVICDGRGNAGTGARAAVLYVHDIAELPYDSSLNDTERYDKAEKIEATTNIVAEHLSMQLGMELALEHEITDLLILNDSQTPVNQLIGTYDTKQPHLKPIVEKSRELGQKFSSVEICWVPREETEVADALCRLVDDRRGPKSQPARRKRPGGPVPQLPPRRNPFAT